MMTTGGGGGDQGANGLLDTFTTLILKFLSFRTFELISIYELVFEITLVQPSKAKGNNVDIIVNVKHNEIFANASLQL